MLLAVGNVVSQARIATALALLVLASAFIGSGPLLFGARFEVPGLAFKR